LEDLAKRLGAQAADRLDVERVQHAVLAGLRGVPPSERPTWIQPTWLRIAAMVVILVGGGLIARELARSRDSGHAIAHLVADDLRDLSSDQLREVLNTLDQTLESGRTAPSDSSFDDLNSQQLRAVLRSLEG
jgi:hypothetical protein